MIGQKIKNFNLNKLKKTTVTASSGLLLLMTFAKDIGLIGELERRLSHLKKRRRGYAVSEKILSFVQMLIKGGDRLSDIDVLRSDPGLLDILMMEGFPRPNTIGDLARRFSRIIKGIEEGDWEKLEGWSEEEEVAEGVHFVGPERKGAAYRFVVVRRRKEQLALFPEFGYSYRIYFTNTDWSKSEVVHFYRERGDAENVVKEEKEGYAVENILSEDFLANAALFQIELLAYNLVQYFKYAHLKRSWWTLRIKQLRYRLINIAGVVVNHARKTILRLSVHYKYFETFC